MLDEFGNDWSRQTVLVTGGLGFLGSHLSAALLEHGATVVVADIDSTKASLLRAHGWLASPRLAICELDITDGPAVNDLFRSRAFDVIYNLAAYSVIERATSAPLDALTTNVVGPINLLEAVRCFSPKDTRFVQASTDKVYGPMEGTSYVEDSPLRGIGIYDSGKLSADVVVRSYFHTYGIGTCVLRMCNVFGPHDYNTGYRLFPRSLGRIFDGPRPAPPILYFDSIGHWRDYIYVGDVVRAFLLLARHPKAVGEAFNMAASAHLATPTVLRLIVETAVAALLDVDPQRAEAVEHNGIKVSTALSSALTIERQHLDTGKIAHVLGFKAATAFPDGVRRTVEHHVHHLIERRLADVV